MALSTLTDAHADELDAEAQAFLDEFEPNGCDDGPDYRDVDDYIAWDRYHDRIVER